MQKNMGFLPIFDLTCSYSLPKTLRIRKNADLCQNFNLWPFAVFQTQKLANFLGFSDTFVCRKISFNIFLFLQSSAFILYLLCSLLPLQFIWTFTLYYSQICSHENRLIFYSFHNVKKWPMKTVVNWQRELLKTKSLLCFSSAFTS
jgi:hypothetical protein